MSRVMKRAGSKTDKPERKSHGKKLEEMAARSRVMEEQARLIGEIKGELKLLRGDAEALIKQRDTARRMAAVWREAAHKEHAARKAAMAWLAVADRPKVVCLCGSTRFKDEFVAANLRETLAGKVVLTIGCDTHSDNDIFGHLSPDEQAAVKTRLDALHLKKIEMADEVYILNRDGYIGESTTRELAHALKLGKLIRWLEPDRSQGALANVVYKVDKSIASKGI